MLAQVIPAACALVVVVVVGMVFFKKCPLGIMLIAASAVAALVSGFGIPLRHIVEGMFTYFNILMVCATGAVFLKALEESRCAAVITRSLVTRFYRVRWLLMTAMMLLMLVPGALTGIAVNSVLSAGVLVAPIMVAMGIPPVTAAVIIGIGAILSMLVPPTNLLTMAICMGISAPFEGFTVPMLFLSVPLAIIAGLVLGLPKMKRVELDKLIGVLPDTRGADRPFLPWLPIIVVLGIMVLVRAFPKTVPDVGTPLIFAIGTVVCAFSGRRINLWGVVLRALSGPMLTVFELLVGVGVFVQIATLTGVRGLLVVGSLSLPSAWAYLATALSLVVSGGILSPFGAAAIFGVPFALFFLGKNQIIVISALTLLAALSQFTPPTAIAGRFAAQVAGVDDYGKVWRASLVPVLILAVLGLGVIGFADKLGHLLL